MVIISWIALAAAQPVTLVERQAPASLSGLSPGSAAEQRALDLVYDRLFYRNGIS